MGDHPISLLDAQGRRVGGVSRGARDLQAAAGAALAQAVKQLKEDQDERAKAIIERQNGFEQAVAGAYGDLQQDIGNVMLRYFALLQVLEESTPGVTERVDRKILEMAEVAQRMADAEEQKDKEEGTRDAQ